MKRVCLCDVTIKASNKTPNRDCDLATAWRMGMWGRKGTAGHVNWNGIHTYIHTHTYTLVYINRYSVKTAGTVTWGSYKVHLSVGTKYDQWQVLAKDICCWKQQKSFGSFQMTYLLQVFCILFMISMKTCCCCCSQGDGPSVSGLSARGQ